MVLINTLAKILVVAVVLALPIMVIVLLIRLLTKKKVKKLIKSMLIGLVSIIPLGIIGAYTEPSVYCEHEYEIVEEIPSTCSEQGEIHMHCPLCNTGKTTLLDKLEHDMQPTENGLKCSACQYEKAYDDLFDNIRDDITVNEDKYEQIVISEEDGQTVSVKNEEAEEKEEEITEPLVELYSQDGRTIDVVESKVEEYLSVGWYKTLAETQQTLYAEDGRTITVYKAEVPEYLNVGWYETKPEPKQTLYSIDGRTIAVNKSEVPEYLKVGWYETKPETQTLYAADGRTITVLKSEVPSYKKVGWYETHSAAQAANKPSGSSSKSSYNPGANGNYYRTPTGKRYHLDPNCGGKNSYRTNNISGLSPCKKCAS